MRPLWLHRTGASFCSDSRAVWLATRSKTDRMSRSGHIETLIAEVSRRRILWDMRDKNYHNRYAVDEEWSQVAKVVDMSSNEAKAKWKSLRDSFRRELKKMPQRDGEDILKNWYSKWAYFESMLFLRDVMKFKDEHIKTFRTSDTEENQDSDYKDKLNGENPIQRLEDNPELENHIEDASQKRTLDSSRFQSKKKRKHDRMDILQKILFELEDKRRDHPRDDEEDDDLNFFKSLLPYMRKLPPLKKLQIRSQYQSILINEMENKNQNLSEAFSNFTYPSSSSRSSSTTVSVANSDGEDEGTGWTDGVKMKIVPATKEMEIDLVKLKTENNNQQVL